MTIDSELFFLKVPEISCTLVKKNLALSPSLKMEQDEAVIRKKQGIVSILGSDSDRSSSAVSLRRTLSADMSSKKWLSQNGFSPPMKKTASSAEFSISETNSSSSQGGGGGEEGENESQSGFHIWACIQEEKNKPLPPPYVHPLVRRSASSISGKSLETCTESLGSETGSEGFSSDPPSETGDVEEEKEESDNTQRQQEEGGLRQEETTKLLRFNFLASQKSSQSSFPPPLSSLSRNDGASTCIRSHRYNGNLVLEAVAVTSKNNFCARRQDGRLVLTFAKEEKRNEERWEEMERQEEFEFQRPEEEKEGNKEEREETREHKEEEEGEEAEAEILFVMDSSGQMSVQSLGQIVNKPMFLANGNPTTLFKNFNQITKDLEKEKGNEEKKKPEPKASLAQSLPPRPPAARQIPSSPPLLLQPLVATGATVASLNIYVVLRKNKQEVSGDELVIKGCKGQRRQLLLWDWKPHCIAI